MSEGWVARLNVYVMRHRRDLYISLAAAVAGGLCQVAVPLISRHILDSVTGPKHGASVSSWVMVLLVVAVATFGFAYLRRYRGGKVALGVQYDLRNALQDHLLELDFATLNRLPSGQLVARATQDTGIVQSLLSMLPIMSGNIVQLVLSLVAMIYLSPLLAGVSLLVAPALLAVSYRMRSRLFPASWFALQRLGDLVQIVDEDVAGVRVVKAFGQERRELERLAASAQDYYSAQLRPVRLTARYQPLLQMIPTLGEVGVLALGGWLALRGSITLGTFLAFSSYIGSLLAPARMLAGLMTMGQQARAAVDRIMQALDLKPAIVTAPHAIELPEVHGEIVLSDVHFSHDESPVLEGLNLRIAPGERVAIVGASGSGKSTLASLIPRFHDVQSGRVCIDGHDVREVTVESLRRQVGVVFEENFLFSDTIRANIAYGDPGASFEQIVAAAQVAHADGFIDALPEKYETQVGERGVTLSGGQRQRIALARALLSDPRILLLDDATSAVDATTEQAIHQQLHSFLSDRTVLLIAHRRSTLHLADRIVLLEHGRVCASGTHDELTANSALYRALITGLEQDELAELAERIESLAAHTATDPARTFAPTPALATRAVGGGLGFGLGGGHGRGGWRSAIAPTPELLAQVQTLPPLRDFASVDLEAESAPDPQFSLGRVLRAFRRPLLFGLLFVVLDAIAGLLGPVLVKIGVDSGVSKGSESVLFAAAGAFLALTLADALDQVAQSFITGRTAERIQLSLRIRIWGQLQRLSLDYYEREMAGRIMTRMTSDVDQFQTLVENGLLSALVAAVTFVGVAVMLLLINVPLALATLTVAVPLGVATWVFRRRSRVLYDRARDQLATVNADYQESVSGVREAQAFVHEDASRRQFRLLGMEYLRTRVAAQRLVALYFPFVQFLADVAEAIVLGIGAWMISRGSLSAGVLIAFILYIGMFFSPIQQLSQVFDAWQQTRISVGRIAELMRLKPLTPPPPQPVALGEVRGALTLSQVRFAYPTTAIRGEALKGITLSVEPGQTVALVGETGAGKSTVMKLLARFYDPDAGSVQLDGHDLRTLELGDFRHRLGYVPQEAFLFSASVRDNIAYGRPTASDAQVQAAAQAVGAHEFITALPGGYGHVISEQGRSLSAGQRQLLALARAELVEPTLLLLDEATANLDLITEARVTEAMQRLSNGRTTVLIAHRMQTARVADRIFVLEHGQVIEAGSHEELVMAAGRYAQMWEAFESVAR